MDFFTCFFIYEKWSHCDRKIRRVLAIMIVEQNEIEFRTNLNIFRTNEKMVAVRPEIEKFVSAAEYEELRVSLGYAENTHDLTAALEKAELAVQYTVAVKNKVLEAYKEIMNMQI